MNSLIIGRDEAIIQERLRSGLDDLNTTVTLLGLSCAAHSVVLSTKLVTERMRNMPQVLVKLGHFHETGRIAS